MLKVFNLKKILQALPVLLILLMPLCLQGGWLHPSAARKPFLVLALIAAGIALIFIPGLNRIAKLAEKLLFKSRRLTFNLFLLATGTLIYSLASNHIFALLPTLDDGVGALFQARLFATGHITIPLPPNDHFFRLFSVLNSDYNLNHWCGMYPPGWPALLTPGVLLGIPWITTPFFGGALAVMASELAEELFGRKTARLTGILLLTSPFVLVLSATHLSHTPTAFFCALCAWAVLKMLKTGRFGWGVLAGSAWSVAFLCRPLTALVMGVITAIMPLCNWKQSLRAWKGIVAAILLAAAAGGTLAAFQHITTGDYRRPGHTIGLGRRGKFGFVYLDHARTHTPQLGFTHTMRRMAHLNKNALGWPLPMYLFAFIPFLLMKSKGKDWWLLAHHLALLLTYSAFWYFESYFPARYSFASMPMLIILCARGTICLGDTTCKTKNAKRVFAGVITGFIIFAVTTSLRHHIREHDPNFGDVESVLPKVVETYGITNAVVFMDEEELVTIREDAENDFYATGFMRNDLTLTNDVIYVRNLREENPVMMKQYPGRNYYLYRYQRGARKAKLYTMVPDKNGSFTVHPVTPVENELLIPGD